MLTEAEVAWKTLNGLICVYKPAGSSCDYVKHKVISSLSNGLNNLETRPPKKYVDININESNVSVCVRPSYADNVLCVGPRYQPEDFEVFFPHILGKYTSGILLMGINRGCSISKAINNCFFTKCYHIKGILGQATSNFYIEDKIIAKAKYSHVHKHHINKVLSKYQAVTQSRIFRDYGLDYRSQEAYEIAVKGLYKPKNKKQEIFYSYKCIEFQPPNFTVEVHCINENQNSFLNLIHNLGINLRSLATCAGIRCIKNGCFTTEHALLKKFWTLEHIPDNMKLCFSVLEQYFPDTIGSTPTIQHFESRQDKMKCLITETNDE